MKMNKHEDLSLEDLAIVGGGCGKRRSHCGGGHGGGGKKDISITININGFAKGAGGCYGSGSSTDLGDLTLPDVQAIPGSEGAADDTSTTLPDTSTSADVTATTIPGAESTTDAAPTDASLGTSLPGV